MPEAIDSVSLSLSDRSAKKRARDARYYAKNSEKVRANVRRWKKANPDKVRVHNKSWSAANPELIRVKNARWHAANPEKRLAYTRRWRATNPERAKELDRRWKAAHPEVTSEQNQRRRALKLSAYVAPVDRQEILERDNWICRLCGGSISTQEKHPHPLSASIDHVVPLARGGTHEPDNVQAAHLGCNARKGARA